MAPARMERNVEQRIIFEDGGHDIIGNGVEPRLVDPPMLQFPGFAKLAHAMGAFANGAGAQQWVRFIRPAAS